MQNLRSENLLRPAVKIWAGSPDPRPAKVSSYMPFGQVRTDVGDITQTDFGYTSQRNLDAQGSAYSLGLMDYKARFYSSSLGRFIQPDTITPGGPQGLNRYSYVLNNPMRFSDPTGHYACIDGICTRRSEISTFNLVSKRLLEYGIALTEKEWKYKK